MNLLVVALAPVFIILIYIYIRDKYNKEPLQLLLMAIFLGILITIPISYVEGFLSALYIPATKTGSAFYRAFVVASFTEELFKYLALFLLIWRHKEFDEHFDGIVYAVFISLGFAAAENVLYVYSYGEQTAYLRAFTAVPAHAVFGITMGYYFSLAKFNSQNTTLNLVKALAIPVLLHGIYDFIIMIEHPLILLTFIPFVIYLWVGGFKKMKTLSRNR